MLYLLDDGDERVISEIEDRIKGFGSAVIPILEETWPSEKDPKRVERILALIKDINNNVLTDELKAWKLSDAQDLLEGVLILNKIHQPIIDKQIIDNMLDKIKLDAWLELNYDLTSFEKVKILNYVFFEVHGFKGDTESYHHSKNSFISEVLESKQGNPVSLAVIYSIVAQRLNIPIYGVNLPQHFVLGYVNNLDWQPIEHFNESPKSGDLEGSEIMFYINPFNRGLIFSRESIEQFLAQLKLEVKPSYFTVCNNIEILKRILRNLNSAFEKEKNDQKMDMVRHLMKVLTD